MKLISSINNLMQINARSLKTENKTESICSDVKTPSFVNIPHKAVNSFKPLSLLGNVKSIPQHLSTTAERQIEQYNKLSCLGFEPILDGFITNADGVINQEKILIDTRLPGGILNEKLTEFENSLKWKPWLSKRDKIALAAIYTNELFSVYDNGNLDSILKKASEYKGTMSLDEIIKIGAGVCRHKSLFFKLICDKILSKDGISAAVDTGFYDAGHSLLSGHGHMWNYVQYDGKTELVDVAQMKMLNMRKFSNPNSEAYEDISDKYRVPEFKHSYVDAFNNNITVPLGLTSLSPFEHKADNNYSGANLRSKNLSRKQFANAVLDNADLSCSDMSNIKLMNASLVNAKIQGADLFLAEITDANFTNADLSFSKIREIYAKNTIFSKVNLSKTKIDFLVLENTNMSESKIKSSKMTKSDFCNSKFVDADFSDSEINKSYFEKTDLTRANFSKAAINMTTFSKSNLTEINLDNATLTETFFYNSIIDKKTYLKYQDKFKDYDFVPAKDFSKTIPEFDKTRFKIDDIGVLVQK